MSKLLAKARLDAAKEEEAAKDEPAEKKKRTPPAADVLIGIARHAARYFHDAEQIPYAVIGHKSVRIRSRHFKLWLYGLYHHATGGKAPNAEAVGTALNTLEAHAINASPQETVFVRFAEQQGTIYYDLADGEGNVVEIDADGWRVIQDPPVNFLATQSQAALPIPVRSGKISELKDYINCPDDDNFALLIGWAAGCFRINGPFFILILTGTQGSAKTSTSRFLKALNDPSKVSDRAGPKELRDLCIWAKYSWVLAMDNISHFPDWLSDACCRLATGGGFGTRTLYENEEESVFDAKRPQILNGIEDFATRADLLERSIILRHPPIRDGKRKMEKELLAAFEESRPRLLGAILDRVSAGLRSIDLVDKRELPRMADATAFAIACEIGMGEPQRFLNAFRQNQADSHELALMDSFIAPLLLKFLEGYRGVWAGTPTELYGLLKPTGDRTPKEWPKTPSRLTGLIKRIEPSLQKVHGIEVTHQRDGKARTIAFRQGENSSDSASDASHVSPSTQETTRTDIASDASDATDDGFQEISRPNFGTRDQRDANDDGKPAQSGTVKLPIPEKGRARVVARVREMSVRLGRNVGAKQFLDACKELGFLSVTNQFHEVTDERAAAVEAALKARAA